MGRHRVISVLAAAATVGITIGVAAVVRDLALADWVVPGFLTVVLLVVGLHLRERGASERPEEGQGDRILAWSWHHPWRSALSAALTGGTIFALVFGVASAPTARGYWRLLPLFLVASALGDLGARLLPRRRYRGDDPGIPARWRRAEPGTTPGMRADARRTRP